MTGGVGWGCLAQGAQQAVAEPRLPGHGAGQKGVAASDCEERLIRHLEPDQDHFAVLLEGVERVLKGVKQGHSQVGFMPAAL